LEDILEAETEAEAEAKLVLLKEEGKNTQVKRPKKKSKGGKK